MNVRRIRKLRIEGFGRFQGQELDIHPHLHLFQGRNEAGKSTLLAFVRGVLFGFEPRSSPRRYEPFFGGPFGGAVWMEDGQGKWVYIRRSGQERAAGRLRVSLPDGRTEGEDWLRRWLGGIDKELYRQVFAFGLDDLQQVRWLQDEALAPFLYHTLLGGASLEAVKKTLSQRERALFRPRGKTGPINMLAQELDELQGRYRELKKQQPDVEKIREQLAAVESDVAALEQDMGQLQERLERLEQMERVLEPFRRLQLLAAWLRQEGRMEGKEVLADARAAVNWAALRGQEEARLEQWRRDLERITAERVELERDLALGRDGKWLDAMIGRPLPVKSGGRKGGRKKEKFRARRLPPALLGAGLAAAVGWLIGYSAWRGEFSPGAWVPAVLLFLAGAVGASVVYRNQVRKLLRRFSAERERLLKEEEQLHKNMAAAEDRLSRLREAETLVSVLGPWQTDATWRQQLQSWASRDSGERAVERERLEAALADMMERYAMSLEKRGRLMQQLDGASKLRDELEMIQRLFQQRKDQLQQYAHQWAVSVVARRALEESVAAFERERQPRTLQRASVYFSRLTGGRYRRVLVPLEKGEVYVEREDGERLPLLSLSRGTAEQLLLAVRLAMADEFSSQAVLPLMMDDIFVNFDTHRLALAVETLKMISRQRQVLFLTCHPHVAAAFRHALAGDDWGYEMLDNLSS